MKGKNIHALAMLDEKAYLEKMRASEKEILEKDMNAKQRKAKVIINIYIYIYIYIGTRIPSKDAKFTNTRKI